MTTLREAAQQALRDLERAEEEGNCEYASTAALRAALEQPPLTFDKLSNALVMSRLIDKDAIENPEEYDDGVTLDQVRAAYRRLV